jgi:hypothetical protein
MNPETGFALLVAVGFLFIGLVGCFWPGETNQGGKLSDGSNVSIKKQDINRYSAPANTVWKPNGWLPGVGKINGHGTEYTFKVWIRALLIGFVLGLIVAKIWGF